MGKFQVTSPNGETYEITAPDGASEQDIISFVQQQVGRSVQASAAAEQPGAIKQAARAAEFGARGFTDSVLETVGAIPDAVASGLRYIGAPAPEKGFYTDKLKQGAEAVGKTLSAPLNSVVNFGSDAPTGALEEGAYGAGRGAADAAAFMVPGAAIAKNAQAGSVLQGVGKTLAANPVMQGVAGSTAGAVTEMTDNPYAGAVAGLAVPLSAGAARRVVSPVGRQLAGEEARLASLAEQNGIKLTAGQATGSKPLLAAESSFSQIPFTSGPQAKIYADQRSAFNKAVLGKAGIDADNAAPAVIDDAYRRIGGVFDDVAARTTVNIDPQFSNDVASVVAEYGRRLPTDVAPVFQSYLDDIGQMISAQQRPGVTGVSVDGTTYQNVASNLRRAARNASNKPDLQKALGGLADSLDGAMDRSVTGEVADLWRTARREYRNLLQIDKSMASGSQADRVSGDIPYGAFSNQVKSADKTGFSRGRGEMNDLARVGSFMGSQRIPDSGTAQRTNMINMLKGAPLTTGGAGAGVGYMASQSPGVAAAAAAGGLVVPKIAQLLMNSGPGQAYLRNNIMQNSMTGPQQRQLLAKILMANQAGQVTSAN